MKSVSNGVWGNPHQAAGGGSSESPPAVFWLQKTLLAVDTEPETGQPEVNSDGQT